MRSRSSSATFVFAASLAALFAPGVAVAADRYADPSTYDAMIATLQPGDVLHLAAGQYLGLLLYRVNGAEGAPITVTGPDSGPPAIILGQRGRSTIGLLDASWIVVKNLEVDNRGNAGSGVKGEGNAAFVHHVTIEGLYLHGFAVDQQAVAISTKCPAWDWTIRGNRIEGAGTGIYLGQSDGTAPFVRGVIEYNVVIDPIGYGMEIKHQLPRPNLAGMPTSTSHTIVRHNVFAKASNASTGVDARPNLLVGHWPLSGPGRDDLYEIYGNLLYENASGTEALFQAEGNVAFHDNVLVNGHAGGGVRVQPHNDVPKAISVFHNTIYTSGTGVSITGADPRSAQLVVANAVFAPTPINASTARVTGNVTGSLAAAANEVAHASTALGTADFHPRAGHLTGAPVDLTPFAAIDDGLDFDGVAATDARRGAYAGPPPLGAWTLALDKKVLASVTSLVDAGVASSTDGSTDAASSAPDASARDSSNDPPDAGPGEDANDAPDATNVGGGLDGTTNDGVDASTDSGARTDGAKGDAATNRDAAPSDDVGARTDAGTSADAGTNIDGDVRGDVRGDVGSSAGCASTSVRPGGVWTALLLGFLVIIRRRGHAR